jgi:UPF0755 protein
VKKTFLIVVFVVLAAGAFFAYRAYKKVYVSNLGITKEQFFYIQTGSSFTTVQDSLQSLLKNPQSFTWVAKHKNYPSLVKPGRYRLKPDMSNNELVNLLRSGNQAPINLVIFGIRDVAQLAGLLGQNLEYDSLTYLEAFTSPNFLKEFNLEPTEVLEQFLPNTYQFYWNASPQYALTRMQKEAAKYWSKKESQLAELNMTPHEVVTLASIVESETAKADEMPKVAGLYLNRIERGIKLQSDPTVIYGIMRDKPNTPTIKRVLFKHLEYNSAYNTYQNAGLPPGPIRLPSITAIEAVLQAEDHQYIFMCADPTKPGYHSFAKNLRGHNRNRDKYIQWVRRQ